MSALNWRHFQEKFKIFTLNTRLAEFFLLCCELGRCFQCKRSTLLAHQVDFLCTLESYNLATLQNQNSQNKHCLRQNRDQTKA